MPEACLRHEAPGGVEQETACRFCGILPPLPPAPGPCGAWLRHDGEGESGALVRRERS